MPSYPISTSRDAFAGKAPRAANGTGNAAVPDAWCPQMNEKEGRQAARLEDGSGDRPDKVPLTARLLLRESLTARRAAGIIAGFTVLITVAGGVLERVVDHREFHTIGRGLWFALQTVTTVGYGDVTPKQADGRLIGAVVMLTGLGFLAVITASVTASLVESSRRRYAAQSDVDETRRLEDLSERLARIEALLDQLASGK
jgi:voltage-gated potassium channel